MNTYRWMILTCNTCDRVHAMPEVDFQYVKGKNYGGRFDIICPYCNSQNYFNNMDKTHMDANKGVVIERNYVLKGTDE